MNCKQQIKKILVLFFIFSNFLLAQNCYAETSYKLRKTAADARTGDITVIDNNDGILVRGTVQGTAPKWPKSASDMATSDHIEIWLADIGPIHFPTPGWGNQNKEERLYSPQDCDRLAQQSRNVCKEWYKKQVKYRSQLIKTFVRQWQIAPNIVEETYATPAFHALEKYKLMSSPSNSDLTKTLAQKLMPLKPTSKPIIHYIKPQSSGYSFEVLIPWNALPPVTQLTLKGMRIVVDIFNPGKAALTYGAYSSNAPAHLYGDPNSFPIYQFQTAKQYVLTPCHYGLRSANPHPYNIYAKDIYYFPKKDLQIDNVMVISNEAFGYQYEPDANSYSPIPFDVTFKVKKLSDNEFICSNPLAYANKNNNIISNYKLNPNADITDKKLKDGILLIKEGPFTTTFNAYGVGQCGACINQVLNIYSVNQQNKKIETIFHYEKIDDEILGAKLKFDISPDWQTIKAIENKKGQEQTKSFCYKSSENKYVSC